MHNERLQVLKMVEDGKINVDEAAKLLETLKTTEYSPKFEEKFSNFAEDMKCFAKDVSTKLGEMYKSAEPKIKEFTKTVVTKTADIADNISHSLNEKVKKMNEATGCCGEEGCCCGDEPHDNGPRPEEKKDENAE
jgi:polyhydroxyalkanoate synthesis regulator phasin